jgi:uncharacterized protein (TIGR02246 family)
VVEYLRVFHHVGSFVALQARLDSDVSRDFSAGPLTRGVTAMKPICLLLGALLLGTCPGLAAQESDRKQETPPAATTAARVGDDEKATAGLVAGLQGPPSTTGTGQPAAGKPEKSPAELEIEAATAAFVKAFNAGDVKAITALFTDDAECADEDGTVAEGKQAIADTFARALAANPGGKMEIRVDSVRFLSPDVAKEEGRSTVTLAGGGTDVDRYAVLYVKKDGKWLQSSVRERPESDVSPHERLQELEWLVGDWINESQDAVVRTSCKWSDDGNFLIRDFLVKTQGETVLSGTQRIGWDPARNQFKTWIFDSAGGFGDGYWSRNGNQWVIKVEGVRRDGQHASATNIMTRLSTDRASWKSVDMTIGGAAVPGIDEFIIVRKPPDPAK